MPFPEEEVMAPEEMSPEEAPSSDVMSLLDELLDLVPSAEQQIEEIRGMAEEAPEEEELPEELPEEGLEPPMDEEEDLGFLN